MTKEWAVRSSGRVRTFVTEAEAHRVYEVELVRHQAGYTEVAPVLLSREVPEWEEHAVEVKT